MEEGGDQSKAAFPHRYHKCNTENDALMHIMGRSGPLIPEKQWEKNTFTSHMIKYIIKLGSDLKVTEDQFVFWVLVMKFHL